MPLSHNPAHKHNLQAVVRCLIDRDRQQRYSLIMKPCEAGKAQRAGGLGPTSHTCLRRPVGTCTWKQRGILLALVLCAAQTCSAAIFTYASVLYQSVATEASAPSATWYTDLGHVVLSGPPGYGVSYIQWETYPPQVTWQQITDSISYDPSKEVPEVKQVNQTTQTDSYISSLQYTYTYSPSSFSDPIGSYSVTLNSTSADYNALSYYYTVDLVPIPECGWSTLAPLGMLGICGRALIHRSLLRRARRGVELPGGGVRR